MEEKHLKTNIAQYALIVQDKKVLVLWPPNGPHWIFPGGRLNEADKSYQEALQREVQEETQLSIEILDPIDVQMWIAHGTSHRYGVFFVCKPLTTEITLSEEHEKYQWISYEELLNHYKESPERSQAGIHIL